MESLDRKIKTREEIKDIVKELKEKGLTIVTTNGSFDILHIGHVYTFMEAAKEGDVFIACLNSDASVKEYKSKDRPINTQEHRARMLAALSCVDYVTIFDEIDPCEILDIIKPAVHVKSKTGYKGIEGPTVEKNGGKIVLIDDMPGISTTRILEILSKS
ncbi:adenylyltransferase/cytidyltransferase family protein [Candidatus Woesearchaeota archaeon]|nr:adenylyltransferase/cytidyltransferase family protein [Candidatus Woesearchaeota archaeon]